MVCYGMLHPGPVVNVVFNIIFHNMTFQRDEDGL